MRRLALTLAAAAAGLAAIAPAAQAQPPEPPRACVVVLDTPAPFVGAPQATANKVAAYTFVCGFPPG